MSARTEIQEIVEWLSDLATPPAAEPQLLPKDTWQLIGRNLKSASQTLGRARSALEREDRGALAEYARDLEGQAAALALRARLLAGLAKPKPGTDKPGTDKPAPAKPASELPTAAARPAAAVAGPSDPTQPGPPGDRPSDELARSAAKTIEDAFGKLAAATPPNAITRAFANDLDLLAELTLSLSSQIARQPGAGED